MELWDYSWICDYGVLDSGVAQGIIQSTRDKTRICSVLASDLAPIYYIRSILNFLFFFKPVNLSSVCVGFIYIKT